MRRNKSNTTVVCLCWILALAFLATACYEPREGCLDANATNFDLDADRACADCCRQPSIVLDFQHRVVINDSVNYNFKLRDSVYQDAGGQPFRFQNISFYLSDIKLVDVNGNEYGVSNAVTFQVFQNGGTRSETLEDNFVLVNPAATKIDTLGKVAKTGTFDRIRFTIGLGSPANEANPVSLPDDHPLNDSIMWRNPLEGYNFARILVFRDTSATDTIPTELRYAQPLQPTRVEIPFGQNFTLDPGFNIKISLLINYQQWFENISDIKNAPVDQLIQEIVTGMAQSVYLVEIVAQSG